MQSSLCSRSLSSTASQGAIIERAGGYGREFYWPLKLEGLWAGPGTTTSAILGSYGRAPCYLHLTVKEALVLSSYPPGTGLCKPTNCRKTDPGIRWTGRQGMLALARNHCLPAHPEMCALTLTACPGAAISLLSLSHHCESCWAAVALVT